jgi:large subunit ribosomal protein L13
MEKNMKKEAKQEQKWWLINAEGQRLGRLSTEIANILRGKNKTCFTPQRDCGDAVIVKNVSKIKLTGNKWDKKKYYTHSGYIGSLKEFSAADILKRKPEMLLQNAVKGMLPKNKLQARFMKKLKIYTGENTPHEAQKPEVLDIKTNPTKK